MIITTTTRKFSGEKVLIHGKWSYGAYHDWGWVPGHGLPEVEGGKEVVILLPCNCGCWNKEGHQASAMNLIAQSTNPEQFVLIKGDERYLVSEDNGYWYIVDR